MQGKHSDDDDQIDLHKFEIQKKIFKNQYENTKYFFIINLATGSKNMAKCSSKYIEDLKRLDVINFSREHDIMFKLNHPSIIKFLGYSLTNFKNKSNTSIVTEYLSKITLNK